MYPPVLKNAIALPIPVDKPANNVNTNANKILLASILYI